MNDASNASLDSVDRLELLILVVVSLKVVPDLLNGLTFSDDVSPVVIEEFGIVSNELEERLNAP